MTPRCFTNVNRNDELPCGDQIIITWDLLWSDHRWTLKQESATDAGNPANYFIFFGNCFRAIVVLLRCCDRAVIYLFISWLCRPLILYARPITRILCKSSTITCFFFTLTAPKTSFLFIYSILIVIILLFTLLFDLRGAQRNRIL